MTDHLGIIKETSAGSFQTPSAFFEVTSFTFDDTEEVIENRNTGKGRGLSESEQGSRKPQGSLEMAVYPDTIGLFLTAAGLHGGTTTTPSGGTNARINAFLQSDETDFETLSFQIQQVRGGTTQAMNIKGVRISEFELTNAYDELLMLSASWVAQDATPAGGDTFLDGGASPAAVSSPTYAAIERAFKFDDFSASYDGSAALDGSSYQWTISGGTALTGITNVSVGYNNDMTQEGHLGSRESERITPGNREVTFEFDKNNDTPDITFLNKKRANTKEPLQLIWTHTATIEGSTVPRIVVTIPEAKYEEAPFGELSGDAGPRDITISGKGLVNAGTEHDFGIELRDSTNGY